MLSSIKYAEFLNYMTLWINNLKKKFQKIKWMYYFGSIREIEK